MHHLIIYQRPSTQMMSDSVELISIVEHEQYFPLCLSATEKLNDVKYVMQSTFVFYLSLNSFGFKWF